jgi:hypothetical protein
MKVAIAAALLCFVQAVNSVSHAAILADSCTPDFSAIVNELKADCAALQALDAKTEELGAKLAQETDEAKKDQFRNESRAVGDQTAALKLANPYLRRGFCTVRTLNCNKLATLLSDDDDFAKESIKEVTEATKAAATAKDQEVVEDAAGLDRQTSNNTSGSAAQLDPVEALQPISLAGGAIALSGTRTGTKGVGTITVNPLALAAQPDDVLSGRILDLAVSAPFDLEQGTSQDRQFVSARLRVNLTAPFSAQELQKKVTSWMVAEGRYADRLEEVLEHATSVRQCTEYVVQNNRVSKEACGQDLDDAEASEARAAAFTEMEKARRAAERYYLGMDLRLDTGDPTGPEVVGDKGTHLLGGLGAGVRISQGERWDWEARMRIAGDYFNSRDDALTPEPEPVYSVDWGGAFILSGLIEREAKQRMAFGFGLEGRQAKGGDDEGTPTNFVYLNLMAVVPALPGGDLGLAISIPLAERGVRRGTVISFTTDLGMLAHSTE